MLKTLIGPLIVIAALGVVIPIILELTKLGYAAMIATIIVVFVESSRRRKQTKRVVPL